MALLTSLCGGDADKAASIVKSIAQSEKEKISGAIAQSEYAGNPYICMYICVYICMYICMYVQTYVLFEHPFG